VIDTRFPVASFAEAIPYLRAPYTPDLVYGRIVSAPDNTQAPCDIALYVSSETVMSRLNIVCDLNWRVDFEKVTERTGTSGEKTLFYVQIRAHVTVFGRQFEDIGEATDDGYAMAEYKARAQSFKRAARWFEVGHCLYAAGKIAMWRGPGENKVRVPKSGENPHKRPYLDEESERYIRQQYENWLERTGEHIYGEPLNHLKAAQERIQITPVPVTVADSSIADTAEKETQDSYSQHVPAPGVSVDPAVGQAAGEAGFSDTLTRQLGQLARDEDQIGDLTQQQTDAVVQWISDLRSLTIDEETIQRAIDFSLERSHGRQAARLKLTNWIATKINATQDMPVLGTHDDPPPFVPFGDDRTPLTSLDSAEPTQHPQTPSSCDDQIGSAVLSGAITDQIGEGDDKANAEAPHSLQPALEQLADMTTRHGYQRLVVQRLVALSQGKGIQAETAWESLSDERILEITRLLSCAGQIGWDNRRLDQMVTRAHTSAQQSTPAGRYAAFAGHLTHAAGDRATETAQAADNHKLRNAA
jgi:hypothetical protein